MRPGLYDHLLTIALQENLEAMTDPRMYAVAPVDAEDGHTVLAQFIEHLLVNALANYRGAEAAERLQRLVDKIVATLSEELGDDWSDHISIATPLRNDLPP